MAKNKRNNKRTSTLEQQKLRQKQYREHFYSKVRHICSLLGDESMFYTIPALEREFMYTWRGAPLKVLAGKGAKVQKRLLEILDEMLKEHSHECMIELLPCSNIMLSMHDYFWAGIALEAIIRNCDASIPGIERFDAFMKACDFRMDQYEEQLNEACQLACWMYDDITQKRLYTFHFSCKTKMCDEEDMVTAIIEKQKNCLRIKNGSMLDVDFRLYPQIIINTLPLETKHVSIKGESRLAIQLGVAFCSGKTPVLLPYFVESKQLRLKNSTQEQRIPVYIQQHAINRIIERTGCTILSFCVMQLGRSLMNPVITPLSATTFLIEYRMSEAKIGYCLSELTGGLLLIRTFLLITSNSTPEGDRLAALTRLQKKDKEYLLIDKLGTLLNSDILSDEGVCQMFRQAGCGSLLTFCEKARKDPTLSFYWTLEEGEELPTTPLARLIREYLKPGVDNEEYLIGEES
jgi:hypothetical protein